MVKIGMIKMVRTYHTEGYGTNILTAWTQGRCEICGRFLSLWQVKYCSIHGKHEPQKEFR